MNELKPIEQLADRLRQVETETIAIEHAAGRILRGQVFADRDSPAANVSAMDGYAIRINDAKSGASLSIGGVSKTGFRPPETISVGQVLQVFTGAIVPAEFDLVIKREDVDEQTAGVITLGETSLKQGMNIRYQGENAASGSVVVDRGVRIGAGHVAAAVNFGCRDVEVSQKVRVDVLVTGDELIGAGQGVEPWQIRDSNGPTLYSLLSPSPSLAINSPERVGDDFDSLVQKIEASLRTTDCLLLTGGVSMGDFDFVPAAVKAAGGETIFHKLPIRPGRPILGAVGPAGQLVLGLPGNPVSAAVGAIRFARPLMQKMAGFKDWNTPPPRVMLTNPGDKTLPLIWFRLVNRDLVGNYVLTPTMGSGDLVSMSRSDGFVEIPVEESGSGPWKFWGWE